MGSQLTRPQREAIRLLTQEVMIRNKLINKGVHDKNVHLKACEEAAHWEQLMEPHRSTCASLRAIAAGWASGRAAFIATAETKGIAAATAATQWQLGRAKH